MSKVPAGDPAQVPAGDPAKVPAGDPAKVPVGDTAQVAGAHAGTMRMSWPVRHLPGRIRRGRPLRLLVRALAACLLALAVPHLVAGQPAAPALVTGVATWFLLTARSDLAPPPER